LLVAQLSAKWKAKLSDEDIAEFEADWSIKLVVKKGPCPFGLLYYWRFKGQLLMVLLVRLWLVSRHARPSSLLFALVHSNSLLAWAMSHRLELNDAVLALQFDSMVCLCCCAGTVTRSLRRVVGQPMLHVDIVNGRGESLLEAVAFTSLRAMAEHDTVVDKRPRRYFVDWDVVMQL